MKRYDYLIYSVKNNFLSDIAWYYTFFTILDKGMKENKYLRFNNVFEVNLNGKWVELEKINTSSSVFSMIDALDVSKDMISNVTTNVKSSVGRFIANKLLLELPFGNKFEYINSNFSIKSIEKLIANGLIDGSVMVNQYIKFVDSVNFMKGLSRITSVSATPKNILPPDGIEKFKSNLMKEYDKKYGKDWVKDRVKVIEFKEELKAYDKEWLKDDPSYGKLTSGKITNNARVKMFLTFGDESGFDVNDGEFEFVEQSLNETYPKDKDKLTTIFNSSRSGSYNRGKETQKGGTVAKKILRATSNVTIEGKDCGSKRGKYYTITKNLLENIKGRYVIESGGKVTKIEDPKKYLGKTIQLRSPMYCLNKNDSFCINCVGEVMAQYKNGISLSTLNISNTILYIPMKKMHNTQVKMVEAKLEDIIS